MSNKAEKHELRSLDAINWICSCDRIFESRSQAEGHAVHPSPEGAKDTEICTSNHDDLYLITSHQSDGLIYSYCDSCKWISPDSIKAPKGLTAGLFEKDIEEAERWADANSKKHSKVRITDPLILTHESNPDIEADLFIILADYSNDLNALKMRDGLLPADAAIARIQAWNHKENQKARIDELHRLKFDHPCRSVGCTVDHTVKYSDIGKRIKELEADHSPEALPNGDAPQAAETTAAKPSNPGENPNNE